MGHPTVRVARAKPAVTGPAPRTPCAKVGTYDVSPRTTAPTPTATRLEASSTRRVKTHSGRIGAATPRSTKTKATTSATPAANVATEASDVQDHAWPPSSRPRMIRAYPRLSSAAPE